MISHLGSVLLDLVLDRGDPFPRENDFTIGPDREPSEIVSGLHIGLGAFLSHERDVVMGGIEILQHQQTDHDPLKRLKRADGCLDLLTGHRGRSVLCERWRSGSGHHAARWASCWAL